MAWGIDVVPVVPVVPAAVRRPTSRRPAAWLLCPAAAVAVCLLAACLGGAGDAFVNGLAPAGARAPRVAMYRRRPVDRYEYFWPPGTPHVPEEEISEDPSKWWHYKPEHPFYKRVFGYVWEWNDRKGEGIIMDQEKSQKYFVIRDAIDRSFHNFKTLQVPELVEFFASDEVDSEVGLPLALNISGPAGRRVKGSNLWRKRMKKAGSIPKRWQDEEEEYPDWPYQWYLRQVSGTYTLWKDWKPDWKKDDDYRRKEGGERPQGVRRRRPGRMDTVDFPYKPKAERGDKSPPRDTFGAIEDAKKKGYGW